MEIHMERTLPWQVNQDSSLSREYYSKICIVGTICVMIHISWHNNCVKSSHSQDTQKHIMRDLGEICESKFKERYVRENSRESYACAKKHMLACLLITSIILMPPNI